MAQIAADIVVEGAILNGAQVANARVDDIGQGIPSTAKVARIIVRKRWDLDISETHSQKVQILPWSGPTEVTKLL